MNFETQFFLAYSHRIPLWATNDILTPETRKFANAMIAGDKRDSRIMWQFERRKLQYGHHWPQVRDIEVEDEAKQE